MRCAITPEGTLRDCVVIEELPAGWGFGEAIVRMARLFQLNPKTVDGRPVEGAVVTIPIILQQYGTVEIRCRQWERGVAEDCRIAKESPPGQGIGRQALSYAEGRAPNPKRVRSRVASYVG